MYLDNIGDCVCSRESIGTGTPLDPPLFFGWTISLNVNLSFLDPDSHRALAPPTPTYRPPPQSRELVPWNYKINTVLVSTRQKQKNVQSINQDTVIAETSTSFWHFWFGDGKGCTGKMMYRYLYFRDADPGFLSRIPDHNFSFPDPGSRVKKIPDPGSA